MDYSINISPIISFRFKMATIVDTTIKILINIFFSIKN